MCIRDRFKGTPRNCGVCHITGSTFNATPKTEAHIQSTNNCAACHDTGSFRPYVHFDHAEVLGTCASCHNGSIAQGEGPTHPSTSQACQACHTVMSWNPPRTVDHTQIPLAVAGFCIICHNGVQASGKPSNHVPTNLELSLIHICALPSIRGVLQHLAASRGVGGYSHPVQVHEGQQVLLSLIHIWTIWKRPLPARPASACGRFEPAA